jgi:prevent-host-death family protein
MSRRISQRELRNDSGRIMREVSRGGSFVVTSNGVPVAELTPIRRRRFVAATAALAIFRGAPRVDAASFRRDVDALLDQSPEPRG